MCSERKRNSKYPPEHQSRSFPVYFLIVSLFSCEFLDLAYGKVVKLFLILSTNCNAKNPRVYFVLVLFFI